MFEESWSDSGFIVSSCGQSWVEDIACYFACLGKSIHAFVYSSIDVTIRGDPLVEVVLVPNELWDVVALESDKFRVGEIIVEVEILDVDAGCSAAWSGDDAVGEAFDSD